MSEQLLPREPVSADNASPVALRRPSVTQAAKQLDHATASAVVRWAIAEFGDTICVGTSFTDTVLVHLITEIRPDIKVIFLDTGFHFAETLATMKAAQARYQLNLEVVRPPTEAVDLWSAGTNACCAARKIDGLRQAMAAGGYAAWFSGLRRTDSPQRANTPVVDVDARGLVKVNPLARWSDEDVTDYVARHDLVVNPLLSHGYDSVGCWPCTTPARDGLRSGRWVGSDKTECGLHQ